MFDSLPPELIRQIIESTIPTTFYLHTDKERRRTLRSLCLVSRRFRVFAQPLLRQILVLTRPRIGVLLRCLQEDCWAEDVQHITLRCRTSRTNSFCLKPWALRFPRLTSLSLKIDIVNTDIIRDLLRLPSEYSLPLTPSLFGNSRY